MSYQRTHPLFTVEELRQPHYWRNHTVVNHEVTATTNASASVLRGSSVSAPKFDLNNLDKYWQAEHGVWARFKLTNTASTGGQTVKPTFLENWFDADAIQWTQNGTGKIISFPQEQLFLETPLIVSEDEYRRLCKTMNHDAALTVGSGTAIAPLGSAFYWIRIPDIFPKGGFPYVALKGKDISVTLRLQNAVAEVASGVLQLDEVVLELNLYELTDSELYTCSRLESLTWNKLGFAVNRAGSTTTLTVTGETVPQKFDNLDDVEAIAMIHIVHASRDALADAYFNLAAIPDTALISINKKGGAPLFSTTGPQYMKKLRYVEFTRQFPHSALLENKALIFTPIEEDMQNAIHNQVTKGEHKLTGDHNIVIENSGLSSSVFIDTVALHHDTYVLENGKIRSFHGLIHA
jgi:hypothetical protein